MKISAKSCSMVVGAVSAMLVLLGPVAASASTPPASDPPVTPVDGSTGAAPGEIVQSWALTTGAGAGGDEPGTRPNFEYNQAPGTSLSDTVVLYNLGTTRQLFHVYATDGINAESGEVGLIEGTETPKEVGTWIKLPPEAASIVLEAGQSVTIPFSMEVPIDASPGDHVGGIVAGSMGQAQTGNAVINVERRTGPFVVVRVAGDLTPKLAVTDLTMDYSHAANPLGGSAVVKFQVQNQGNVRLGGPLSVSVAGPFGLGRATVPQCADGAPITPPGEPAPCVRPLATLLPGQKVDLAFALDGVPALFLDTTEVKIALDNPDVTTTVRGSATSFVPPITLLLIGLVLVLGWQASRAYRRRADKDGGSTIDELDAESFEVPVS